MDLIEGIDMQNYLNNENLGPPSQIENIQEVGCQLITAIKYLHNNEIIHQNIMPRTIMFTKDFKMIKLIDLGFCM